MLSNHIVLTLLRIPILRVKTIVCNTQIASKDYHLYDPLCFLTVHGE